MSKFGDRLRYLRTQKSLSQQEFANQIKISKSSVNMYERGEREPGLVTLEVIADFFNVDLDYLLGKSDFPNKYEWLDNISNSSDFYQSYPDNILPLPKMNQVPLLGTIACGAPILAQENIDEQIDLPEHIHADFALRCKGDSMINARIFDGDIVYIRQQPTVQDGQIAAVLIDGEATLKRVRLFEDHLVLEPENPQYRPLSFWGADMNTPQILGLAVAFTSTVK